MKPSIRSVPVLPRIALLGVALIASFASVYQAQAQQGRRMIVNENGDGSGAGPQVMMLGMAVDFFSLREPDFIKKDVPTFTEQLMLSEPQTSMFDQMIDTYLTDFEKLCQEMLPKIPGQMMHFGAGEADVDVVGGPGGEGPGEGAIMFAPAMGVALGGGGEEGEFDLDPMLSEMEGDFGGGMAIGLEIAVGGPDDGGGGGNPDGPGAEAREGGVSISIAPSNGQEISEEDRQRLQEQAQKIAEQIRKQMEERDAAEANGEVPAGGMFAEFDPEKMQRDHEEMEAKAEAFRKAKSALRQKFVTEAQSQLAGSQIERWPNLERTLRRHKTLPKGRLSGERTDLVRVLKDLKLGQTEQQAVASQSEAYELAMENALVQRNTNLPEFEKQMDQAMQKGDDDKALTALERATALRLAVRTVNEQFTDTLAAAMPAEMATAFRKEVLRRSYPNVYRKTFGQKNFDAARKIENLDPKTLASIEQLETGYHAELDGVNAQLKAAIDKHQPDEPRWPIEHMKAMRAGDAQPEDGLPFNREKNPIRDAFTKRRELDQRYAKMVREMLTPEQQEALPKPLAKRAGEPIIIEMPAREPE